MPRYISEQGKKSKRRNRKAKKYVVFSCVAIFILVVSWGIVSVINLFSSQEEDINLLIQPSATISIDENTNTAVFGPVMQEDNFNVTKATASLLALPENGRVHLEYFDDALFLGDSLAEGFASYTTATSIDNASFLTARSISPLSFINDGINSFGFIHFNELDSAVNAFEEVAKTKAKKVYVILGLNALASPSLTDEDILNGFNSFLDELKNTLPDSLIYVSSITPTTKTLQDSEKENGKDFSGQRITSLNEQLALLCSLKGVHYLDVYPELIDENGYLAYDGGDGIHLSPSGYSVWASYIISHTFYDESSPLVIGSPYTKE